MVNVTSVTKKIFSRLADPSTFDFSDMSSEEIAYYLGQLTGELVNPIIGVSLVIKTGLILNDIAESHAIDSSDSDLVSDNLFECLDYLD